MVRYLSVYLFDCLSICLSVHRLAKPWYKFLWLAGWLAGWQNLRVDFSETSHDKFLPNITWCQKRTKNGILARKTFGATDPILCMHIQLHSGSKMSWVPPDYTSIFSSVTSKICQKWYFSKALEPRELDWWTHIYLEST